MACPKCPKHFHQSQVAKVNWVEVKVVVEKATSKEDGHDQGRRGNLGQHKNKEKKEK